MMHTANPIANALVVLVGVLVIAASVVLGFVAFVVLGSVLLVLGAIVSLRMWWLNRKLGRTGLRRPGQAGSDEGGVIEGECHVVKRDENP